MPFAIPEVPRDMHTDARDAVIRLNQEIDMDVQRFISAYENFWAVSGTETTDPETGEMVFVGNGSELTLAEMQRKIDLMPQSAAMGMLMLAGLKRDMIMAAEQFLGEQRLPTRYRTPAFTMQPITSAADPIVLTGLAAVWERSETP